MRWKHRFYPKPLQGVNETVARELKCHNRVSTPDNKSFPGFSVCKTRNKFIAVCTSDYFALWYYKRVEVLSPELFGSTGK